MCTEKFFPCKNEPDIWIRPSGDHYKYVCIYIDNLIFIVDNSPEFVNTLQDKQNFKLKDTEPIRYYLEANFSRDTDGTLTMSPKKYITERLVITYLSMFEEKSKTRYKSPLDQGDHSETDISELPDTKEIQQF